MVFIHANPDDVTWNSTKVTVWSAVEPCIGVVTGCIPSLRPLLSGHCWIRGALRPSSGGSTSTVSKLPWVRYCYRVDDCDIEVVKPGGYESGVSYEGVAFAAKKAVQREGPVDDFRVEDVDVPYGNIEVKTEISWSWNDRIDYDSRLY